MSITRSGVDKTVTQVLTLERDEPFVAVVKSSSFEYGPSSRREISPLHLGARTLSVKTDWSDQT